MAQLCIDLGDWKELNNTIQVLAKRRAQLRTPIKKVVQAAMQASTMVPDDETYSSLLETLRSISSGKIHLEEELVMATFRLAEIRESRGAIKEASDLLQELQVETFGTLTKREQTGAILEQTRLCLDAQDFIRARIVSNKIGKRVLDLDELQDMKYLYERLIVRYFIHERDHLGTATSFQAAFNLKAVQRDRTAGLWKEPLGYFALFLVLSPFSNTQHDLLQHLKREKLLEDLPVFFDLVTRFTTDELINWPSAALTFKPLFDNLDLSIDPSPRPLASRHRALESAAACALARALTAPSSTSTVPEVEMTPAPRDGGGAGGSAAQSSTIPVVPIADFRRLSFPHRIPMAPISTLDSEVRVQWWSDFRTRVVEHNIRVVAKYYSHISMRRFADLLDLPASELEGHLGRLVTSATVYAKIDRPAGFVKFNQEKSPADLLNTWSSSVDNVVKRVDQATHRIRKEMLAHLAEG